MVPQRRPATRSDGRFMSASTALVFWTDTRTDAFLALSGLGDVSTPSLPYNRAAVHTHTKRYLHGLQQVTHNIHRPERPRSLRSEPNRQFGAGSRHVGWSRLPGLV